MFKRIRIVARSPWLDPISVAVLGHMRTVNKFLTSVELNELRVQNSLTRFSLCYEGSSTSQKKNKKVEEK